MRDYTKFFTPSEVANRLVGFANIRPFNKILEPSAGDGSIVRAIHRYEKIAFDDYQPCYVHAVEKNKEYIQKLINSGCDYIIIGDFLHAPLPNCSYDSIIANPPFGHEHDINSHLSKMYELLKPSGRIVSIVPDGSIITLPFKKYPLKNWSENSDGTMTKIAIVTIIKL